MNKKLMALIACVSIAGFGTYMYGASYAVLRGRVYSKIAELKKAGKSDTEAGRLLKDDYKALNDLLVKRNLVNATKVAMDRVKSRIINDLGQDAFDELGVPAPVKKKTLKGSASVKKKTLKKDPIVKEKGINRQEMEKQMSDLVAAINRDDISSEDANKALANLRLALKAYREKYSDKKSKDFIDDMDGVIDSVS